MSDGSIIKPECISEEAWDQIASDGAKGLRKLSTSSDSLITAGRVAQVVSN